MTRSRRNVRSASVPPRYRTAPAAKSSAGREAVELAASAGLTLDPWQAEFLIDALGEDDRGRWAAWECGLVMPRQNGKGSILEARELAGLFLFDESLILHSAHEFKTAQEAFRRVLTLIQSTPDLDRLVKRVRTSHGEEGIELLSGQRLRFVARSTGSGRGFSGDCVILDEAYYLTTDSIAALLPTMSAMPNPQLWYASSAPLERDESTVLRRLCRRGREQAETGSVQSLVYVEYAADPDAADDDEAVWRAANPACPHRISPDFIAKERAAMPPEEFRRERLGMWVDRDGSTVQVLPAEDWAACLSEQASIDEVATFAIDVSEDRRWGAIAAAGRSNLDQHRMAVEVVANERGTAWIAARARKLVDTWGGEVAVAKGSPAAALLADLVAEQVPVRIVSGEEMAQACGQLLDAVVEHRIHHRGQPVLDVAVRHAVRRDVGDAWVWSRRRSSVDISPLVAVTLAAMAAPAVEPEAPEVAAFFVI